MLCAEHALTTSEQATISRLLELRKQSLSDCSDANCDALAELLRLLHAPAELTGFVMVARNLRRIFRRSLRSSINGLNEDSICRYQVELRWIIHDAESLALELFNEEDERERFLRTSGRNPMIRHGAERHGLWCLLWEVHPDKANILNFRALQQHALFAHISILRYWSTRDEWQNQAHPTDAILRALYRETLAVRHFAMPKYRQQDEYLSVLSSTPVGDDQSEAIVYLKGAYAKYSKALTEHSDPRRSSRIWLASSGCSIAPLRRRQSESAEKATIFDCRMTAKKTLFPERSSQSLFNRHPMRTNSTTIRKMRARTRMRKILTAMKMSTAKWRVAIPR